MRAQRIEALDGPESIRAADIPAPEGGGQLLIDVVAAGVSFPDVLMSRGLYQMKPPLPFVPGVEVAGTVREAPPDSGFAAGDRVMAVTMLGGFAEVAAAPAAMSCRLPQTFSFEQGAGFILNYHTVHFALTRRAAVLPGETVVVHGAAGGIGTAAIQVARCLGAEVVAVTSSPREGGGGPQRRRDTRRRQHWRLARRAALAQRRQGRGRHRRPGRRRSFRREPALPGTRGPAGAWSVSPRAASRRSPPTACC